MVLMPIYCGCCHIEFKTVEEWNEHSRTEEHKEKAWEIMNKKSEHSGLSWIDIMKYHCGESWEDEYKKRMGW